MTHKIVFEKNPSSEDIHILDVGIMENAQKIKAQKPVEFFAFFLRDENGQIQGGCNCEICHGLLFIGQLWVTETLRGQGYGTRLMQAAEKYAIDAGCSFLAVNTMDWEALNFYKKLGYYVEFERHGFAKDSVMYLLRKDLTPK
jgi:ribosomal protein S18 acetylase RimI-like enzyme